MAEKVPCPSRVQLEEVLRGNLDLSRMEVLEQHLKSCSACEQTLQNLQAEDTFTDMIREEASKPGRKEEPIVEKLIGQILKKGETRDLPTLGSQGIPVPLVENQTQPFT